MTLGSGQAQVRDLIIGPGTDFALLDDFDPWSRQARADSGDARAWDNGSWSGAEWAAEAVVPMRIRVRNPVDGSIGGWLAAHRLLAAAFRPSAVDLPLTFEVAGAEYVLFGRPRMVEPDANTARRGYTITRAGFVALDPLIYSGALHVAGPTGIPAFSGGLTVPVTVPFTIDQVQTAGVLSMTNAGTADTRLLLRIDGPIDSPSIIVTLPDATIQTLTIGLSLGAGQWLDIDTKARTIYADGSLAASRRGYAYGDWPLLPSGTSSLTFHGDGAGTVTASWRDAWW